MYSLISNSHFVFQAFVLESDYGKPMEQMRLKCNVAVFILLGIDPTVTKVYTVYLFWPAENPDGSLKRTMPNFFLPHDEKCDSIVICRALIMAKMKFLAYTTRLVSTTRSRDRWKTSMQLAWALGTQQGLYQGSVTRKISPTYRFQVFGMWKIPSCRLMIMTGSPCRFAFLIRKHFKNL